MIKIGKTSAAEKTLVLVRPLQNYFSLISNLPKNRSRIRIRRKLVNFHFLFTTSRRYHYIPLFRIFLALFSTKSVSVVDTSSQKNDER
mgnify:CR=1 FL=1